MYITTRPTPARKKDTLLPQCFVHKNKTVSIIVFSAKQIKTIFILEYVFTKNKVDNLEGSRRKSGLDRLKKDGLCPQSSAFLGFKD